MLGLSLVHSPVPRRLPGSHGTFAYRHPQRTPPGGGMPLHEAAPLDVSPATTASPVGTPVDAAYASKIEQRMASVMTGSGALPAAVSTGRMTMSVSAAKAGRSAFGDGGNRTPLTATKLSGGARRVLVGSPEAAWPAEGESARRPVEIEAADDDRAEETGDRDASPSPSATLRRAVHTQRQRELGMRFDAVAAPTRAASAIPGDDAGTGAGTAATSDAADADGDFTFTSDGGLDLNAYDYDDDGGVEGGPVGVDAAFQGYDFGNMRTEDVFDGAEAMTPAATAMSMSPAEAESPAPIAGGRSTGPRPAAAAASAGRPRIGSGDASAFTPTPRGESPVAMPLLTTTTRATAFGGGAMPASAHQLYRRVLASTSTRRRGFGAHSAPRLGASAASTAVTPSTSTGTTASSGRTPYSAYSTSTASTVSTESPAMAMAAAMRLAAASPMMRRSAASARRATAATTPIAAMRGINGDGGGDGGYGDGGGADNAHPVLTHVGMQSVQKRAGATPLIPRSPAVRGASAGHFPGGIANATPKALIRAVAATTGDVSGAGGRTLRLHSQAGQVRAGGAVSSSASKARRSLLGVASSASDASHTQRMFVKALIKHRIARASPSAAASISRSMSKSPGSPAGDSSHAARPPMHDGAAASAGAGAGARVAMTPPKRRTSGRRSFGVGGATFTSPSAVDLHRDIRATPGKVAAMQQAARDEDDARRVAALATVTGNVSDVARFLGLALMALLAFAVLAHLAFGAAESVRGLADAVKPRWRPQ